MNAPVRFTPATLPVEQIQQIIAKATALLAKPERDGIGHLALLCALDTLDGHGALEDRIADMESDLGLGDADEPECLSCGTGCDGACDRAYDDRVAYGMSARMWL